MNRGIAGLCAVLARQAHFLGCIDQGELHVSPNRLFTCLLITLPAHANDRTAGERVLDGFGFAGSAALGATAGALTGGLLAEAGCDEATAGFFGCGLDVFFGAALGGGLGLLGGALAYDGFSDGDGSLWGAAGGLAIGTLAGVAWGKNTRGDVFQRVGGFTLVFVGMGAGYALFDATSVTPTASIVPDGKGGTRSTLGLTGRF